MTINKTIKKPALVPVFTHPHMISDRPSDRVFDCLRHIFPSDLFRYEPIIVCIGTPEITGDRLGPLVGSILEARSNWPVFGTLTHPVHALNFKRVMDQIRCGYEHPYIIAVDAALGHPHYEGFIAIKKGPVRPGEGLGKKLPAIGDAHITGIFSDLDGPGANKLLNLFGIHITQGLLEAILTS